MLRFGNFLFPEGRDPDRDAEGIADSIEEARRRGIPAFEAMQAHRKALRERICAEQAIIMKPEAARRRAWIPAPR